MEGVDPAPEAVKTPVLTLKPLPTLVKTLSNTMLGPIAELSLWVRPTEKATS